MDFKIPVTLEGLDEATRELEALKKTANQNMGEGLEDLNGRIKDLSQYIADAGREFELVQNQNVTKFLKLHEEGFIDVSASISLLEDRMYSLRLQGKQNTEEYAEMVGALGELKNSIIETDREADIMAKGGLASLGEGFGQMSESLLTLDFKGFETAAKTSVASMGNLGKTGANALKSLSSGVATLTKAFVKMGVSLLANPVFLLAAAIVAVVAIVVVLLQKFGLLQPILDGISWAFEQLKKGVDVVVQGFKDLTDWLGFTDNAGEEFVNNQIKEFKKYSEASEKVFKDRMYNLDEEIKIQQAFGKDTAKLEEEKQRQIIATKYAELERAREVYNNAKKRKDIDAEEITALREKIEANKELVKVANTELKVLAAKAEKKAIEDTAKAEADRAKQAKENAEARKKYLENRLQAERAIKDILLESMEEGLAKELAVNEETYKRLIEDTKRNENLLQAEKQRIIELRTEEQKRKEAEIQNKFALIEEEDAKAYAERISAIYGEAGKSRTEEIEAETSKRLEALRSGLTAEQKLTREFLDAEAEVIRQQNEKLKAYQLERTVKDAEALLELEKATVYERLEALKFLHELELEDMELSDNEKLLKVQEYEEKRRAIIEESETKIAEKRQSLTNAGFQVLTASLDALAAIQEAKYEREIALAEGNETKQNALRKKAFEENKRMQIASATVNMIQGAITAFAGAMSLGPILGPIVGGVLAASVVAMGMANISKIRSTKFGDGSGGVSIGGADSSSASASVSNATPSVNMYGSANPYSETRQAEPKEQSFNISAYVVESEVTETQERTRKQRERSEL